MSQKEGLVKRLDGVAELNQDTRALGAVGKIKTGKCQ